MFKTLHEGNKWCATTRAALKQTSGVLGNERPMPDAPACRGRDGAGCGFGAIRQVNYTKKKSGVVTATYYKKLCKRCNDGKRPASRSPSPQRRPPVQRVMNCFGGDANAVSHRQVGRGHGLRSLWLCEALYRLLELYEILHAVQASRSPTKAQQVPLP